MITLQSVSTANVTVFKTVRLRALQDSPAAFGSTYANESLLTDAQWLARIAKWNNGESGVCYIAMDAEAPVGIIAGFFSPDNRSCASLVSMWVTATHRRRGVGRMLVAAVIDWARSRRAKTVRLDVVSNNLAAIKFYRTIGFSTNGVTKPYPNDPTLIEHEMICAI